MVTYSTWVSIVRDTAESQGADLNDFDVNSQIVSVAAEVWRDRKTELERASENRAEVIAQAEVNA